MALSLYCQDGVCPGTRGVCRPDGPGDGGWYVIEIAFKLTSSLIFLGASLGIVVLIGVCCGSCLWCLKHDSAYSSASRLVSAYSIR